jgi:hypothetical protein
MIERLKTIKKRLLPIGLLLQTRPQLPENVPNVLAELRMYRSLHRLLGQQLRCSIRRESLE